MGIVWPVPHDSVLLDGGCAPIPPTNALLASCKFVTLRNGVEGDGFRARCFRV